VSVRFSIAANWGHLFHNSNLFCEEIKHFKPYEIRLVTKKLKNNDVYSIRPEYGAVFNSVFKTKTKPIRILSRQPQIVVEPKLK